MMSEMSIITKIKRHDKCSSCYHADLDSKAIDGYHTYCSEKREWIFDLDDITENGCFYHKNSGGS